ncbi:MAG: chaperonin GroEL [Candidatus Paceibacterota bacterium]
MAKKIYFNDEARKALKRGIDQLSDAVKMTLGPRGRAVVIEKSYGAPQVTLDGVTVAKEIELEDRFENLGASLIKQAADKTNDNVGDGTTTSIILAQALIEEGEKAVSERGFNVIRLADEIAGEALKIITLLESQAEAVKDNKKIKEVATLSAKDPEIGSLIADVFRDVGKSGVITIEDSNTISNSSEVVKGLQFDKGYISQYMVTNTEKMQAEYEEPYILITDQKISAVKDILPLVEKMAASGKKDLVIIAEEIDGEALATLVVNKIRGIFNTLAIKAPSFGDRRKEMLADIAIVTGGKVISEEVGLKLENVEMSMLGRAGKVIATKDDTTIVAGRGKKKEIEARVVQITEEIKRTESKYDQDKLAERLGKLSGGVAVLKIGAPTESAQKELKQRVEDAVAATRAAMEEGVVPGGGVALFNTILDIPEADSRDEVVVQAREILRRVLTAPLFAIIENSGEGAVAIIDDLIAQKETQKNKVDKVWLGFNAAANKIEDLKKAGIVDPLKVTKTALMNAVSVATNFLTIGVAVTDIPKKEDGPSHDMPSGGMY